MNINELIKFLTTNENISKIKLDCPKPTCRKNNIIAFKSALEDCDYFIKTNQELLFLLKNINNIHNLNIFCPICGNKNSFNGNIAKYSEHCSIKCAVKDSNVLNKRFNTKIKRYGDKYYNNRNKFIDTCINKYGVINISQCDYVKNKVKRTKFEHFGDENFNNNSKSKLTCLRRYGVDSYVKTKDFKIKMLLKNPEINLKKHNTMKKNNTFGNKSKPENNCYNYIKQKFNDAIHHFFDSNRYPYECDIYIPSIDLFIECNFYWMHGGEAFNKNNEKHIKQLNDWKNKNNNTYNYAINIWTISDPLKLETFKKNNLNYKIFYTEKEFKKWFDTI